MGRGILVLGAGGHAKVVVATLLAAGRAVLGLLDDNRSRRNTAVLGVPVLGAIDDFERLGPAGAVIAIGDNKARKRVAERFPDAGASEGRLPCLEDLTDGSAEDDCGAP